MFNHGYLMGFRLPGEDRGVSRIIFHEHPFYLYPVTFTTQGNNEVVLVLGDVDMFRHVVTRMVAIYHRFFQKTPFDPRCNGKQVVPQRLRHLIVPQEVVGARRIALAGD